MSAAGRLVKYWKEEEVTQLLEEIKEGKDLKEIAAAHSRTESSVLDKLKKIALKLAEDGRSTEEIIHLTSLTKKQIEDVKLKHRAAQQAKILVMQTKIDNLK